LDVPGSKPSRGIPFVSNKMAPMTKICSPILCLPLANLHQYLFEKGSPRSQVPFLTRSHHL
jgi:hypothetical protein